MHRPRHRPRSSAPASFSLLVALAALILACVPALAQADSSEKQYVPDVPESGIPQAPKKEKKSEKTEPQAKASTPEKAQTGPSEPSGGEKGSDEESEKQQGGAATGTDNGGNNDGGSAANNNPSGNGSKSSPEISDEKPLGESPTQTGENAAHSSGGSSPLVPILIAVAVLAAISIGAVLYRQRRQGSGGSGSPVSPNA